MILPRNGLTSDILTSSWFLTKPLIVFQRLTAFGNITFKCNKCLSVLCVSKCMMRWCWFWSTLPVSESDADVSYVYQSEAMLILINITCKCNRCWSVLCVSKCVTRRCLFRLTFSTKSGNCRWNLAKSRRKQAIEPRMAKPLYKNEQLLSDWG